jgi:hypothetical protein
METDVSSTLTAAAPLTAALPLERAVPAQSGPTQNRPRLSQADMDDRRESLRCSAHESLIEGARPDPATDYIFEAYVRGQIDATELIPWLDKHYGTTRQLA